MNLVEAALIHLDILYTAQEVIAFMLSPLFSIIRLSLLMNLTLNAGRTSANKLSIPKLEG